MEEVSLKCLRDIILIDCKARRLLTHLMQFVNVSFIVTLKNYEFVFSFRAFPYNSLSFSQVLILSRANFRYLVCGLLLLKWQKN